MEYLVGVLILFILLVVIEYRLKNPDQLILSEKNGNVYKRKGRFYPRHFSIAIPANSYSVFMSFDCEAKGKLELEIKLAVTISASSENIQNLIKIGGWSTKSVQKASKELEIIIQGMVKDFTEKYEIDELSSEKVYDYIKGKLNDKGATLGIDIISLSIQSIEPADKSIAEALRQREEARIKETTEKSKQLSRVAEVKVKLEADEKIAQSEHELGLKKLELKKIQEQEESKLALIRIEEEMKRNDLQLNFDKKELELINENPELLMLTPQIARLAEASQNLKNAKTIVSLSGNELEKGSELSGILQAFIYNMMQKQEGAKNN